MTHRKPQDQPISRAEKARIRGAIMIFGFIAWAAIMTVAFHLAQS